MNNPDQRVSQMGLALGLNAMATETGYMLGSFWIIRDDDDPNLFEVGRIDLKRGLLPSLYGAPDETLTNQPIPLTEALCLVAEFHGQDLETERLAA